MDLCPVQSDGVNSADTPGKCETILYLICRNEHPGGTFFWQNT